MNVFGIFFVNAVRDWTRGGSCLLVFFRLGLLGNLHRAEFSKKKKKKKAARSYWWGINFKLLNIKIKQKQCVQAADVHRMLQSAVYSGASCCVAVEDRLIFYWENCRAGKMRIAFRDHFLFKIQTHLSSKALSSIRQNDAALVLKRWWGTLQQYGKTTRWQYVNSVLSKGVFMPLQLRRFSFFPNEKKKDALKRRGNL